MPRSDNSKSWHDEKCPFCEERRFFKEPDSCERPKKRRCEDEKMDNPEKCWFPPCPDWYKCPPPWFWCKPEHEEKKECERKDDCDRRKDDCDRRKDDCDRRKDDCDRRKDDCDWHKECERRDDCDWHKECERKDDKRKEKSADLEAYAYVYALAATAVTVLTNNDVVFTNNGPMDCINHTPNTSQLFIRKSGVYEIFYGVVSTLGAGATISLAVNGAVNPSTTIPIQVNTSDTVGKVLLPLHAGDFLTLRNSAATAITLALTPAVSAQLTLERIDDIDCFNY